MPAGRPGSGQDEMGDPVARARLVLGLGRHGLHRHVDAAPAELEGNLIGGLLVIDHHEDSAPGRPLGHVNNRVHPLVTHE